MNSTYLILAVVMLLLNGFFVGAEFALTAARRTKLEAEAEKGEPRAKRAIALLRDLSFTLAGAQLGITMASLALGAVAEPAVAELLESALHGLDLPEQALHTISFVIALTIVVFFHMVIGEMAPKNIAIAEPEKSALRLARPFRFYLLLFGPLVRLLNGIANAGLKLIHVEAQDELASSHSAEELKSLIDQSAREGMLGRFQHRLLGGAIGLSDLDAAAAMVPRTEMTAVPATATPAEVEGIIVETGFSRIPVFGKDLDHVLGFFHAKDLLRIPPAERDQPVPRRFIRPMLVVPESRKLPPLLLDMRRERRHFALVIEEHGGTAGVVSIEDVVEELVGEIHDEYDISELDIEVFSEGRYVVPGTLRIDELRQRLGLDLPEGEYETVAGFIMDSLGRIPKRRDLIEHDGWTLRVRSMQRRRVVQVIVEEPPG